MFLKFIVNRYLVSVVFAGLFAVVTYCMYMQHSKKTLEREKDKCFKELQGYINYNTQIKQTDKILKIDTNQSVSDFIKELEKTGVEK
jgi:hypothetical protein